MPDDKHINLVHACQKGDKTAQDDDFDILNFLEKQEILAAINELCDGYRISFSILTHQNDKLGLGCESIMVILFQFLIKK